MLSLFQELAKHIDDYTTTYEPDDQLEWSLVLGEIRAFIEVSPALYLNSQLLRMELMGRRIENLETEKSDRGFYK